jgi:arylsulfate sulfotransferase
MLATSKSPTALLPSPLSRLWIGVHSAFWLSLGCVIPLVGVVESANSQDLSRSEDGLPAFTVPPTISPNPNPKVPLAAVLQFTATEPVDTLVEVSDGVNEWTLEFEETQDSQAGLPIIGMRPDRSHTLTVTIRDADGNQLEALEPLTFRTPSVTYGVADFPPLDVRVSQPEQMEPGVTMLSVRRNRPLPKGPKTQAFNQSFGLLLALDAQGVPVWFYQHDSRISDFELLDNGNIAYLTQDFRLREIDLLGNIVQTWWATERPQGESEGIPIKTATLHHDVNQVSNGNLVVLGTERRFLDNYYTSEKDPTAPRQTQPVMGDQIIEFTPEGEVVWTWNSFDFLDPFRIGYETFNVYWRLRGFPDTLDWTHANNLVYDEKDNSLLASFRHQSAIVKVDRSTGELVWILANPQGWPLWLQDKLFTLEGEAEGQTRWFYHQHSPEPSHNGTVLLYDNGSFQAEPFEPYVKVEQTYSRAVEYEIDEANGIIRQVWSSEIPGEEKVITFAMGDVDALPQTDNVLLSQGWILHNDRLPEMTWDNIIDFPGWTRVREFSHETPPEILWEVVINEGSADEDLSWFLFASERIQLPTVTEWDGTRISR